MGNNFMDFTNLGIYDLRNLAREFGVVSPTKLKRDELIAKIEAIVQGEAPEAKRTNRGRPPHHKTNGDYKLKYAIPNNLFKNDYVTYQHKIDKSSFNNTSFIAENNNGINSNILFDGYFLNTNECYGFALKKGFLTDYVKENVVVLDDLINKYNLKNGDYIVGACQFIKDKNIMLATDIETINNKKFADIKEVENAKSLYPTTKIQLADACDITDYEIIDKICPIVKGGRTIVNFENNNANLQFYINLINTLTKQNKIETHLISIDDLPEELNEIAENCKELNIHQYYADINRNQFLEKVDAIIKNCQRKLVQQHDVAIIFYNAQNYLNNVKFNLILQKKLKEEEAKIVALNKLKDVFNISRNYDCGSLSVVFFNAFDEDLRQIANTYLYFNNFAQFDNVKINLQQSFTKNIERILTEDEQKKYGEFITNTNRIGIEQSLKILLSK